MENQINNTPESPNTSPANSKTPAKKTSKQIVAIIGVVLLVLLYIITLFTAIFDKSASGKWFLICLVSSIAIPFLIWIYTWMYGKLTGKHTIADFDINFDPEEKNH